MSARVALAPVVLAASTVAALVRVAPAALGEGASRAPQASDSAARAPASSASPPTAFAAVAAPFALVELYTSEGCSSCPPAEHVFSSLLAAARASGTHLYALAFHVDYWDSEAWTDPWSDAAFSDRQSIYSG